jgi:predicted nucleic acid-binding Zn ribbon protein
MAKRKNQYEITEAVEYFLRDAGILNEYHIQRAIQNWAEIAGAVIAAHTDEIEYQNGILYLKMENSAWTQEVLMHRTKIKEKIHEYLGQEIVREIQVKSR